MSQSKPAHGRAARSNPVVWSAILIALIATPFGAHAATEGAPACAAAVEIASVATSPGATAIAVPVLLTSNRPVRGVQFDLGIPADLQLRDCAALAEGFTCAMRDTPSGVTFVFVSLVGAPLAPGADQAIFELIFDVDPLVLDRQLLLPMQDLQVLGGDAEACGSVGGAGRVQVVAGCEFYFEDMESGAAGWTHGVRVTNDKIADPVGPDTWHLDDATCVGDALGSTMYLSNGNRGPACLAESSRDLSQLVGPPIGLPHSGALALSFDALSYDEAGECRSGGQYDRHDVGLTLDGGLTYTLLNDCTPLTDGSGALFHHEFDISDFAGLTAQLIFVYDTEDVLNGHSFAVDNVRIHARDMICGSCDGRILLDPPPPESPLVLESCGAIVAGGAFHVGASRQVALRSGTHVALTDGFRVEPGGRFSAVVDPTIVDVSKTPILVPLAESRTQVPPSNRRVSDD